ncbi:MAG TPA: hypothetical protein PKC25_05895, partial [Candidatus Rifleibacterium sp.]|nr:hypothetical protein [Candidatus Rifleibacterium sp.]
QRVKAGDKILDAAGVIEVLAPQATTTDGSFQQYYDGLILKISHKERNYLFLPGNAYKLEEIVNFKPDFIFVADLPSPVEAFEKFVKS